MLEPLLAALSWLTPVSSLTAVIITYRWLHEPKDSKKRPWRNLVLALSCLAALSGFYTTSRSGRLAGELRLLQQIVDSDDTQISELKKRLKSSDASLNSIAKTLTGENAKLLHLKDSLSASERERLAQSNVFRAGIIDSQQRLAAIRTATQVVQSKVEIASANSRRANTNAQKIALLVTRSNGQTKAELEESLATARAAAAKAGVYNIPPPVLTAMVSVLSKTASGRSEVACVPGFEHACDEIADAFLNAGWNRSYVTKSASLLSGSDDDLDGALIANAGLIIWYRPTRLALASILSDIMKPAGFTIALRQVESPAAADLEITVRFLQ